MIKKIYLIYLYSLCSFIFFSACHTNRVTTTTLSNYQINNDLDNVQFFTSCNLRLRQVTGIPPFHWNGIQKAPIEVLIYPKGIRGTYEEFSREGLYVIWDTMNRRDQIVKNPSLPKDSLLLVSPSPLRVPNGIPFLGTGQLHSHTLSEEIIPFNISNWDSITHNYFIYSPPYTNELYLVESRAPSVILPSGITIYRNPRYNVFRSSSLDRFLVKSIYNPNQPRPHSLTNLHYPTSNEYRRLNNALFIQFGDQENYGLWFAPNSSGYYELVTIRGTGGVGAWVQIDNNYYEIIDYDPLSPVLLYTKQRSLLSPLGVHKKIKGNKVFINR